MRILVRAGWTHHQGSYHPCPNLDWVLEVQGDWEGVAKQETLLYLAQFLQFSPRNSLQRSGVTWLLEVGSQAQA